VQKANPEKWIKWLTYHDGLSRKEKKIMITYLLTPQLSSDKALLEQWKVQHQDYHMRKQEDRNIKYLLPFIDTVCLNVFITFWNISLKGLYALIHHLRETQMPIPQVHANHSRIPSNKIPQEDISKVEIFLSRIKEEEGEVIATRTYKRKLTNGKVVRYMEVEKIIYLPSHLSIVVFTRCIFYQLA